MVPFVGLRRALSIVMSIIDIVWNEIIYRCVLNELNDYLLILARFFEPI